jgi:hypothetical protein
MDCGPVITANFEMMSAPSTLVILTPPSSAFSQIDICGAAAIARAAWQPDFDHGCGRPANP